MNLSDVEKEIMTAVSVGKEIELLYDPEYPIWETRDKLHIVLQAIDEGISWRIKKKIKTIEYGVYLQRFSGYSGISTDSYIEPVLWICNNNLIYPSYESIETMPKFIKWVTKGTYDIEEE